MSIATEAILALATIATIAISALMSRWAAEYDIKSWFVDAVWRFVFRQGWRQQQENAKLLQELDATLKRQLVDTARDFQMDRQRLGQPRAAIKHVGRIGIAYLVSWMAGLILLVGLSILAHTVYRGIHA